MKKVKTQNSIISLFAILFIAFISFNASVEQNKELPIDPGMLEEDYVTDIDRTQEFLKRRAPKVDTLSATQLHNPLFGTVELQEVVNQETGKKILRVEHRDPTKKIEFSKLTISEFAIEKDGETVSVSGKGLIFDDDFSFKSTKIDFEQNQKIATKIVLDLTFIEKPTLAILPKVEILLDDKATLIIEENKPIYLISTTTLFDKKVEILLVLLQEKVDSYVQVDNLTLGEFVPGIKNFSIGGANIEELTIASQNVHLKRGQVQEGVESTSEFSGKVSLPAKKLFPVGTEETNIDLTLSGTKKDDGYDIELKAENLALAPLGTINEATIGINTTAEEKKVTLSGQMPLDIDGIGVINAEIKSGIKPEGLEFSGSIDKEVSFAGITISEVTLGYDTVKKALELVGDITVQGMQLKAELELEPDPDNPKKKKVSFTARSEAKKFAPFEKTPIPGLSDFEILNLDAGLKVTKVGEETKRSFYFEGDTVFFGKEFDAEVKFVENKAGQKGVFVKLPLDVNKKISDIIPELKNPIFDGLELKHAAFQLSNIDFINPDDKEEVKKGITLTAKLPLTGTLAPVGKFLGTSNQLFTLYGAINPQNPRLSEFGIKVAQGDPNSTAKVSIGDISVVLSGKPEMGVDTRVYVRPNKDERLEFIGGLGFNPTDVALEATMDGDWQNPFGISNKISVGDLALKIAMAYGSPGLPTELGGAGSLELKDLLNASIAFNVDATLQELAFEGKAAQDQKVTLRQVTGFVNDLLGINIPTAIIPKVTFYDIHLQFATQDTKVGEMVIEQGIVAKGTINLYGAEGELDLRILPASGIVAYGRINPLNFFNILKIDGHEEEDEEKLALNTKRQVLGEGQKLSKEEEDIGKPRIDVELTMERQKFLIAGELTLVGLVKSATFVELSSDKVLFDFEAALGGGSATWQGKPLFLSHLRGESKHKDFDLLVEFEQHLQEWLADQVSQGIQKASAKVEEDLNKAINEINKINDAIAQAQKAIDDAEEKVAKARSSVDGINKAIDDVNAELQKVQDEINSVNRKKNQYIANVEKGEFWYGPAIPFLEAAHKIALGVTTGAFETAKGSIIASRETAKGSLVIAQEFLDKVVENVGKGTLIAARESAQNTLKGVREGTLGTLKGADAATQFMLKAFSITQIKYEGSLSQVADGVLGNVEVTVLILGNTQNFNVDIDVKEPASALAKAFEPIVKEIVQKVAEPIADGAKKAADETGKALKSFGSGVISVGEDIGKELGKIENIANDVAGEASKLINDIKKELEKIANAVEDAVNAVGSAFEEAGQAIIKGAEVVGEGIVEGAEAVADVGEDVGQALGIVSGAKGPIVRIWNATGREIVPWVKTEGIGKVTNQLGQLYDRRPMTAVQAHIDWTLPAYDDRLKDGTVKRFLTVTFNSQARGSEIFAQPTSNIVPLTGTLHYLVRYSITKKGTPLEVIQMQDPASYRQWENYMIPDHSQWNPDVPSQLQSGQLYVSFDVMYPLVTDLNAVGPYLENLVTPNQVLARNHHNAMMKDQKIAPAFLRNLIKDPKIFEQYLDIYTTKDPNRNELFDLYRDWGSIAASDPTISSYLLDRPTLLNKYLALAPANNALIDSIFTMFKTQPTRANAIAQNTDIFSNYLELFYRTKKLADFIALLPANPTLSNAYYTLLSKNPFLLSNYKEVTKDNPVALSQLTKIAQNNPPLFANLMKLGANEKVDQFMMPAYTEILKTLPTQNFSNLLSPLNGASALLQAVQKNKEQLFDKLTQAMAQNATFKEKILQTAPSAAPELDALFLAALTPTEIKNTYMTNIVVFRNYLERVNANPQVKNKLVSLLEQDPRFYDEIIRYIQNEKVNLTGTPGAYDSFINLFKNVISSSPNLLKLISPSIDQYKSPKTINQAQQDVQNAQNLLQQEQQKLSTLTPEYEKLKKEIEDLTAQLEANKIAQSKAYTNPASASFYVRYYQGELSKWETDTGDPVRRQQMIDTYTKNLEDAQKNLETILQKNETEPARLQEEEKKLTAELAQKNEAFSSTKLQYDNAVIRVRILTNDLTEANTELKRSQLFYGTPQTATATTTSTSTSTSSTSPTSSTSTSI